MDRYMREATRMYGAMEAAQAGARHQSQGDRLRGNERQSDPRLRAAARARQGPEGNRPAPAGFSEASGRADEQPDAGTRPTGDPDRAGRERRRAPEDLSGSVLPSPDRRRLSGDKHKHKHKKARNSAP